MSFLLHHFLFLAQRSVNLGIRKNIQGNLLKILIPGLTPPARFWFHTFRFCSEICPGCKHQVPVVWVPYLEKQGQWDKDIASSSQSLLYIEIEYQINICRGEAGKVHVDIDPWVFLMCPKAVPLNLYCVCESGIFLSRRFWFSRFKVAPERLHF